jgi:hypothetical protein
MPVEVTAAHWVYLVGVVALIAFMIMRRSVVLPAIVATFLTTWVYTGNPLQGIGSVFSASLVAATEFLSIFLVLMAVTAMLGAMKEIGADQRMIAPIARLMRNGVVSYFVLFGVTYLLSMVFWPTPSLALIAAILLPAAIRAGLSPLAAAMAIAIAGQGMALASDYVLGVAPSLSASGANVPADLIANRALVLSWIVGAVAILITFVLHVRGGGLRRVRAAAPQAGRREAVMAGGGSGTTSVLDDDSSTTIEAEDGTTSVRDIPTTVGEALVTRHEPAGGTAPRLSPSEGGIAGLLGNDDDPEARALSASPRARMFAALVPLAFLILVAVMLLAKLTDWVAPLDSGNGAALVGGLALLLMLAVTLAGRGEDKLERVGEHVVDGLLFAFRAMGIVIPVAGFVLVGISDFAGRIMLLPEDATPPGFLFDLIASGQDVIPDSPVFVMFAMLLAGMLIGLDGSGWAGLPFTGGLADALAQTSGADTATLAAIAQNAAGWTGGGTLIIWSSLVAVAGLSGVSVITLARKLFIPVVAGLLVSTVVAAVIW